PRRPLRGLRHQPGRAPRPPDRRALRRLVRARLDGGDDRRRLRSMPARPARIGMIAPSSNTAIEPLTTRIFGSLGEAVTVHFTRIRVTHISLARSSLEQFTAEAM